MVEDLPETGLSCCFRVFRVILFLSLVNRNCPFHFENSGDIKGKASMNKEYLFVKNLIID